MKKTLLSLLTVGAVGSAAFAATGAFFSDTETSTGNVLQAGAIDLRVSNSSYYNGVAQEDLSWQATDLTVQKFFNYDDLKPGDWGESTIDLITSSNPSWLCANVTITENSDNGINEPEDEVDGLPGNLSDGTPDGDLAPLLNFAFWLDDGDNVFEDDESVFLDGPAANVLNGGTLALVDSNQDLLGTGGLGMTPEVPYYIGKYWCFGDLGQDPEPQDGLTTNGPSTNRSGFTCSGASGIGNIAQTDRLVGNMSFYVEQVRNNPDFLCSQVAFPTPAPSVSPSPSVEPSPSDDAPQV